MLDFSIFEATLLGLGAALLLSFWALMASRAASQRSAREAAMAQAQALQSAQDQARKAEDEARRGAQASEQSLARFAAALEASEGRVSSALSQGLAQISEAGVRSQVETLQIVERRMAESLRTAQEAMERRLKESQGEMGQAVSGAASQTAQTMGELRERLEAIDRAQAKIEALSADVLGLQDILANKQARGAFGEIQLNDLVTDALPPGSYAFQAQLSNGKRVDALLKLPHPPGPIAIDAKFPLEPYEALRRAQNGRDKNAAEQALRKAIRTHLSAISEKYIVPGETADGALMFLPSEAVYAELHANFPELVREGFERRVWIVSPTTLMATLTTMRAVLRDARLREEARDLRNELALLAGDVERLAARAKALRTHFSQAEKDIGEIEISARKSLSRARKLDDRAGDDAQAAEIETLAIQASLENRRDSA